MASPHGGSKLRRDPDGVRIVRPARRRRDAWLVAAAGLGVLGMLVVAYVPSSSLEPGDTRRGTAAAPVAHPAPDDARAADGARDPVAEALATESPRRREILARRIARKILPRTRGPDGKPEVSATDAIATLRALGITDGIAAFSPPGTDPVKPGVIVPDDVELPEGYLRHHQTTDDGTALPPILLFHPDYEFVDEAGAPIAVPADRVVPPEWVPPGIPIRMLDVPEPPAR